MIHKKQLEDVDGRGRKYKRQALKKVTGNEIQEESRELAFNKTCFLIGKDSDIEYRYRYGCR